jgi:hypothetical protein
MKRFTLILCLWTLTFGLTANELRITARADWMLTLRSGVEYHFHRNIGIQADLGTNLQLIALDAGVVFFILDEDQPWRLNVILGIPNAAMPLTYPAGMLSFGGSAALGYGFRNGFTLDIRVGAGYPLFFEHDREMIRDTGFPLHLWPDLAIVGGFPIGGDGKMLRLE